VSIDDADAALRITEAGRQRVLARLRDAVAEQMRAHGGLEELDPETLEQLLQDGIGDAGAALWRISLAEGAADEFGIDVHEALSHPAVEVAAQLIGAPGEPEPVDARWLADMSEPEPAWGDPAVPPPPGNDDEPEMYIPPGYEADGEAPGADAPPVDAWGAPLDETAAWQPVEPDPESDPEPPAAEPEPEPEPAPEPPAPEREPEPDPEPPAPEPLAPPPVIAPSPAAIAVPQALRVAAVHTSGIESLKAGDEDIELRLSEAGLDVIKRSSGIAIGRLDWGEITAIEVQEPGKRGRRRRKSKNRSLQVDTGGGQASFELVGLSDEETAEHLEPLLSRLRASGALARG
jgi:outer membrane biosynthesis protein TonB